MANLSRKQLEAMGLNAEQVEAIIEAHADSINGLKGTFQARIDSLEKDLEEAKNQPTFKEEYDRLKEDFKSYKKAQTDAETKTRKAEAYKSLLKDLNISEKRFDSILKLTDVDALKLDDDGKLIDADDLKKSAEAEWSDFIRKTETKGVEPKEHITTGGSTMTREQILNIKDTAERQKAIQENADLFVH